MGSYLQRHEFLRHVLTLMSGTALAQVILVLTTPVITRLGVTTEVWGVYNACFTALSGFVIPFSALRYDLAIVLPRNDDDARQLFRITTAINTFSSLAATLVMVVWGLPIARWLMPHYANQTITAERVAPWMPLIGLLIWSYAQVNIVNFWSNRMKRFNVTSTTTMTNSIVTAGSRMGSALGGFGPVGLVVATLVGEFGALGNFFVREGRNATRRPMTNRSTRALLRAYSNMPLLNAPNAAVDAIRISGIPMSLSHFFGTQTTGAFNMAWTLVQAPMALINNALSAVFFQKLSVTPRGQMYRAIRMSIVRSLLVGLVPFGLIATLGPWFMPIFLGKAWGGAGVVAAILVPWLYFSFVTSPVSTVFVVARRQGVALCFAVAYMALPLGIIFSTHSNLDHTLLLVSVSTGALLAGYCFLAMVIARAYDNGHGIEHDAEQTGLTGEELAEVSAEQQEVLDEPTVEGPRSDA